MHFGRLNRSRWALRVREISLHSHGRGLRYFEFVGHLASTPSSRSPIAARFAAGAKLASTAVVAVAALVLVGWLLRIPTLVQLVPGLASMKPNTAVALGMLGIALRLSIEPGGGGRAGRAGR